MARGFRPWVDASDGFNLNSASNSGFSKWFNFSKLSFHVVNIEIMISISWVECED